MAVSGPVAPVSGVADVSVDDEGCSVGCDASADAGAAVGAVVDDGEDEVVAEPSWLGSVLVPADAVESSWASVLAVREVRIA